MVTAPVELLRDVHIVDTPGTNAIIREHERLTTDFVPRSDLVLFVTSADRPFTETERAFLAAIRDWGKKIVIVVNKVDIFSTASELEEVLDVRARHAARDLLGVDPTCCRSARALRNRPSRENRRCGRPAASRRWSDICATTLDAPEPLPSEAGQPARRGPGARATGTRRSPRERLTLMEEDLQLLADIERQLAVYREDMERGFELRMAAVEKELADMEARGHRFFEDTLRIGRVVDLLNRARVQKEFEEKVVADAPMQIERRVTEMIDWLVDQDFRQWQAVTSKLSERHRQHASRMLGAPDVGSFTTTARRLMDSVGREAQRVVDTYDKRREAEVIADQARVAVAAAAAAGGAAVGLGTLVTIAASTVAADVTGILLASVVLGDRFPDHPGAPPASEGDAAGEGGGAPRRLTTALRTEFARAQEQSAHRLGDAVAPYARFVRAEERRWSEAQAGAHRSARAHQRLAGRALAAVGGLTIALGPSAIHLLCGPRCPPRIANVQASSCLACL